MVKIINLLTGEQNADLSPHAATHHAGGTDAISAEAIGARPIGVAIDYGSLADIPEDFWPKPHFHLWSEIVDKPDSATRWPLWTEVGGKPSLFPPSSHGTHHRVGGSDYYEPINSLSNFDFTNGNVSNKIDTGFYQINYFLGGSGSFGLPFNTDWVYLICVRHVNPAANYSWQIVANLRDTSIPFQIWTRLIFNNAVRTWQRIL